ncbi:NAD-binding protein [Deinococcus hopiensis]|uniref:NAD-binding protein n=1 Tax=Deinococcus hopiensis TaxID=309885 RepID=UPI001BB02E4F|nr:NAD-binding protein [Deinococcus hopiensis]
MLGKNTAHIGEAGAGQVAKICSQIAVALTAQAVAEALTLARERGVDGARRLILDLHGQRMLGSNFAPGLRICPHRKDLRLAGGFEREQGVPLFATAGAAERMNSVIAQEMGDLNHSGLPALCGQLAGLD